MRDIGRAGANGQGGDGADAWERFAAEPECGQAVQVLERGELRRRVPADRQRQIRWRDAATVIDDLDQFDAATPDCHSDPRGAGIDSVFDEFLDGGNWALDDLSSGDLADRSFVKQAKCHAASTR